MLNAKHSNIFGTPLISVPENVTAFTLAWNMYHGYISIENFKF